MSSKEDAERFIAQKNKEIYILEEKEKIAAEEVSDAKKERSIAFKKAHNDLKDLEEKFNAKKKEVEEFEKLMAEHKEHKKNSKQ